MICVFGVFLFFFFSFFNIFVCHFCFLLIFKDISSIQTTPVLWMSSFLHIMSQIEACRYRLQRVTSLRRRARANAPDVSYWLRRVPDDGGRRE